jgi:hypothetical protein
MRRQSKITAGGECAHLAASISLRLQHDDDRSLWAAVLRVVYSDARMLIADTGKGSRRIATEIGCCSHWLRPHQTRWTADGGFAWPSGYGGSGSSRFGLPELDWSVFGLWDWATSSWVPMPPAMIGSPPRQLTLRIAIPARSARHAQAAVHTLWRPGPPQHPHQKLLQLYGFRRLTDGWKHTAYHARPSERAYEGKIASAEVATERSA